MTVPAEARTRSTDKPLAARVSAQVRLAAQASRWLLPVTIVILLATDFAVGFNWVLSSPQDLRSPAYDVAKTMLSMDAYGAIFIGSAFLAATSCIALGRAWVTGWLIGPLLGGIWVWWAVLYARAAPPDGVTYAGAIYSLSLAAPHLLVGLAVTHRTGTNNKLHRG